VLRSLSAWESIRPHAVSVAGIGAPMAENGRYHPSRTVRSLVVRAWVEADGEPALRVRLVEVDVGANERPVLVTASIDEACTAMRWWLEGLRKMETGQLQ
jgi:hypothetical protein